MKYLIFFVACLFSTASMAEEYNRDRAHFNYQMFCQGCHAPGGASSDYRVPRMKDHVGTFINSQQGREFLVRVPGAATSSLDDEELAEVLNWIVVEFSGDSLVSHFEHYTPSEVGILRQAPLNEVADYRAHLLADIAGAQK